MAYKTKTAANLFTNNSDANARAWVQFISNGLDSAGIPKTADTGQINTSTFTATASINTAHGYEIRRFNDTLQATAPVFFKLEYGSGGAAANPAMWLTVGTGSNGSGTITGILFPRTQIAGSSIPTNIAAFALSGDTNRLTFAMHYLVNTSSLICGIERTKDASGDDTADGILVVWTTSGASGNYAFCPFSGSIPGVETTGNCLIPTAGTTSVGANVGIYPPIFFWFGENVNANKNFYGYRTTEILTDAVITASVYGANTDYLTTGIVGSFFASSRNSNAYMMRWES